MPRELCYSGFEAPWDMCFMQPFCGDDICDAEFGEDCETCPADCGECIYEDVCCFDGFMWRVVASNECFGQAMLVDFCFEEICCEDVMMLMPREACLGGAMTPPEYCVPEPFCGDGTCDPEFGEDCGTCEIDCGACPVPDVCCWLPGEGYMIAPEDECVAYGEPIGGPEVCSEEVCCDWGDVLDVMPRESCPDGMDMPIDACYQNVCCQMEWGMDVRPAMDCGFDLVPMPEAYCYEAVCCDWGDVLDVLPRMECPMGADSPEHLCHMEICCVLDGAIWYSEAMDCFIEYTMPQDYCSDQVCCDLGYALEIMQRADCPVGADLPEDACYAPPKPTRGDVIFTEIMQNPTAASDPYGEWFELANLTDAPLDLSGCVLRDAGTDSHVIDALTIDPGEHLVFAHTADPELNGGLYADYDYAGLTLSNSDDELFLECDGTLVDMVAWDGGPYFPDPAGASMALLPDSYDWQANDNGAAWFVSTEPYGRGDRGTPGEPNVLVP